MYYFIPSRIEVEKGLHRDIIPWYRSMQRLEFDDTIHQIRIFKVRICQSNSSYKPICHMLVIFTSLEYL